ncbi:unnamed protein product [Cylindrotheca closterium]|uniref:Uncharacterized protein n=1 Tax=Cylindrotheca closterium TaxID=2856 RepID=A0AAD2CGX6_9STRA|nr:unnamed protein product [Cylindrotheca closterium]
MKLLLSLALASVTVNPVRAQCTTEFCPSGITLEGGEVDLDGTVLTCSEFSATWSTILNAGVSAEECVGLTILAGVNCCPTRQDPASCFLCGSAEATFDADKILPGGETRSCGIVDALLSYSPTESSCSSGKSEFDQSFNLVSYCECSDVPAPELCKPCDDNQDINTTALIPGEDGLTCVEGFEYARHVTNQAACDEIETSENKAACCIDMVSSGISLSTKSLAACLLLSVMFAI